MYKDSATLAAKVSWTRAIVHSGKFQLYLAQVWTWYVSTILVAQPAEYAKLIALMSKCYPRGGGIRVARKAAQSVLSMHE